ncbi:hypothetical protein AB0383_33615 [Amycolatopsis sp. NPDC051373]|uniref:hypothetical protein n=1 Tax=Amycolatopsis sp. NPDC051373 TaxID=3155801 RepID=UPI00344C6235
MLPVTTRTGPLMGRANAQTVEVRLGLTGVAFRLVTFLPDRSTGRRPARCGCASSRTWWRCG